MQLKNKINGFSIMELAISLGIIVLLGILAYPSYQNYMNRVRYKSIIEVANVYKKHVTECFDFKRNINVCNAGSNKIPAAITTPKDNIASVTVNKGIITVTPIPKNSFTTEDTYVLIPKMNGKNLTWEASGRAVEKGYAAKEVVAEPEKTTSSDSE